MTLLVLLMAAAAVVWLQLPPRPQPLRVRRNPLQEELLAAYINQRDDRRR